MSNLQESIAAANQRAGQSRQKVFAKKAFIRQTDAQIIDMLCERAEELLASIKTRDNTVCPAMKQAILVARRQQDKR